MKFLEEDVRLKQSEKQWKDNVRNAWEISPTLAIFLLKRLGTVNAAQVITFSFLKANVAGFLNAETIDCTVECRNPNV